MLYICHKIGRMKQKDIDREYRKFFTEWLPKFTERLTLSLLNLKDRREIKEEDWEAIKSAHRLYYFGYLPDYILPWQHPQKESKQTTIFDNIDMKTDKDIPREEESTDRSADNNFGLPFAIEIPEPTIIIENGQEDKKV